MPICRYLVSPGGARNPSSSFAAGSTAAAPGGIHGLAAEHEDIEVDVVPYAEAMRRLEEGDFTNAISIIALQWLALHPAGCGRPGAEPTQSPAPHFTRNCLPVTLAPIVSPPWT